MQRYFITSEATYEILRQSLNTTLGYPNNLGKSIFHTPLQAPRDSFRRMLLAVDTAIAGYSSINAAITPLLAGESMEELDEATYLTALASAGAGGVSSWNDLTDRPAAFPPTDHTHTASAITDFASAVAAASPEEVLEYTTAASFPATGNASLIYIATDAGRAYRWVGSQYAEIGPAGGYIFGSVRSDTVGSTSYIGRAAADAATSASVWKIRRTILTAAGVISSTATATNVAWNNRLTATYS